MKVIKRKNLPTKFPLFQTLITAIALDFWNAPQWLWGALGLLFLIIWVSACISFYREKEIDVFNDKKD